MVQFPDSSWLFTTVSPDVATNILLGKYLEKGIYIFPEGSSVKVDYLPTFSQGFNNLTLNTSSQSSFIPLSISYTSFSSGPIITSPLGSTTYTLTGTNSYNDAIVLASTNIITTTNPNIVFFNANSLGNTPNSPTIINYEVINATSVSLTSNMRSITVPNDAFSGSLTLNNPLNGEIITLAVTDSLTNTTQQLQLTIDTSNKIFNCIVPGDGAVPIGLRSIFNGSGEITIESSPDSERLYFGRAISTPAVMYLKPNLIEFNGVLNMGLCGFNFFSDGIPCILASDSTKVYVCQPAGGKVSIFDNLTQAAIEEITAVKPTNIEVSDQYIFIRDLMQIKIYDKITLDLLQVHPLTEYFLEANDRQFFVSSDKLFILDGRKVKIINLSDISSIDKTIELDEAPIITGSIVYAETLDKIFVVGLTQDTTATSPTFKANLWVYNLTSDEIESVTGIGSTTFSQTRFGMRLDIDESRIFVISDWMNKVFAISTDKDTQFKVLQSYNTLKPYGIAIDPTGKYLYYSGQDANSYDLRTQRSRHLVLMRLFETKFTLEFI